MRRIATLLLCATIVSLAGCDALRGRLLTTELPALPDAGIEALPVGLHDITDLVSEIEPADAVALMGEPWIEVSSIDGQPNSLRVAWMGGACLGGIHVEFRPDGEGYVLKLEEQRSIGGMVGCPALGVNRSVILRLSSPVSPESVRLDYTLS